MRNRPSSKACGNARAPLVSISALLSHKLQHKAALHSPTTQETCPRKSQSLFPSEPCFHLRPLRHNLNKSNDDGGRRIRCTLHRATKEAQLVTRISALLLIQDLAHETIVATSCRVTCHADGGRNSIADQQQSSLPIDHSSRMIPS